MSQPEIISPPRRAGRPPVQDAAGLTERILTAAEALFIADGLPATSIERVAAESGTTRRTILHRFPTKELLFQAVVDRYCLNIIHGIMETGGQEADPPARLRAVCRNIMDLGLSDRNMMFFRNCATEIYRFPDLAERIARISAQLDKDIAAVVLDAQASGFYRTFSAAALANCIVGAMLSNPLNRASMGDPLFLDRQRRELYFSQTWSMFAAMA